MSEYEEKNLADEYYRIIDKPKPARQYPQFALCMIGVVGSGKSTVLKKLSQLIPMVRESGDEVRKLLHDKGLPQVDSQTLANIGERVINRLIKEGYRVAYDNDFANSKIREQMLEHNRKNGVPIVWIRIDPPEEFAINKLTNFEHTYLFKDAKHALETYHQRKALHKRESAMLNALPYIYTFDTSSSDLDRQIEEAAALIRARLERLQPAHK